MDGMTLIMALATIGFVGGLIRSFFTKRPEQETKNEQLKSEEDRAKELRELTLHELKMKVLAETPRGLMVEAKPIEPKEKHYHQSLGRARRESIEERWNSPFDDDGDISIPVRPKPGRTYDAALRERHQKYLDRKPEYHFLPPQGQVSLRILPAAPNGMNGLNPNPWYTTQQLHYIPETKDGKPQTVPCNRILGKDGRFVGNCPICTEYERISREMHSVRDKNHGTMEQEQVYRQQMAALKPTQRYYVNAMEWDEESKSYGPVKVLSLSKPLFEKIKEGRESLIRQGEPDPFDLDQGRNFKVVKRLKAGRFADWSASSYDQAKRSVKNVIDIVAQCFNLCRLHVYLTEPELADIAYNYVKRTKPSPGPKATIYSDSHDPRRNYFESYLANVRAWVNKDKILNPFTGHRVEPDERLMQRLERHISNWYARNDCDQVQFGLTMEDWRKNLIEFEKSIDITDFEWHVIDPIRDAISLQVALDTANYGKDKRLIEKASPCYANNTAKYRRSEEKTKAMARKAGVDEDFIRELMEI